MKRGILMVCLSVAVAAAAAEAPDPDVFEREHGSSFRLKDEAVSQLADPVEEMLARIRMAQVVFNEAPMPAVLVRLQRATAGMVSSGNRRGINLALNTRSLGDKKPPVITFAARDVSVLEVIRYVCAAGGLQYRIADGVLVLEKAGTNAKKGAKNERPAAR